MTSGTGHGSKLSRKREAAIAALLTESTLADAAKKCGVSESTLKRWTREPSFAEEIRSAQRRVMENAVNVLLAASESFAKTLATVSTDTKVPAAVRSAAASRGMEILIKATSLRDIEERLDALEFASGERAAQ